MDVELYHGTTKDRANKIFKDGIIKTTCCEICRHKNSKSGFIYVTERLCDAMDFASRPEIGKNNKHFVVFKIVIDNSYLCKDNDEEKWNSTLSPDGFENCYKIQKSLTLGEEVIAYLEKEISSDDQLGRYIQAIQYNEIIIPEQEWNYL